MAQTVTVSKAQWFPRGDSGPIQGVDVDLTIQDGMLDIDFGKLRSGTGVGISLNDLMVVLTAAVLDRDA